MKRRRKLKFEKHWQEDSTSRCVMVTDSWIMHCIFEAAEYSHMEIVKIKLKNLGACQVIAKAHKMEFQNFVHRLIDKLQDLIENVDF